ncbi:tRNA (adenosine(37)-N6)-threonylcarbamoyltransferase complex transferase subunit TsaD [Candidatus Methylacidithermus pantelleriae]|uniref:tRNA N6-adenosine threonylcarbamoyltransferase n=1 Tax=Candidatus Methylacidithermus pantelleriae TaxID=2744239 RepID=A0A8J2BRS1_9BACT|nr:tRNA (adenosine(37)-N6)-threonylcarbamoyltransferase complex transferase subunit TsaD [Candidatus Methylacidithermus pantelleriae]CAF0705269.1 tRNA N6-adenosine threonylcarbamoyltransferase [Candidatus Methylacidithermus pantelleriae]
MRIVAIETSCDETAVAILEDRGKSVHLRGSFLATQAASHRPYGGVVPEIAVREHARNLPLGVERVLAEASLRVGDLQGVAATRGPGLASSLLVGYAFGRSLALGLQRPFWGINHLEGHLLSPFWGHFDEIPFPFLGLIVSGGHTLLVLAKELGDYQRVASTVDDAAGEALDKIARLLGLGYPGGPAIERMAQQGNPKRYVFPQACREKGDRRFSFSGLKTAVRYFIQNHEGHLGDGSFLADVCASVQEAVMEVLAKKTVETAIAYGVSVVALSGGVACNQRLRQLFAEYCHAHQLRLAVAPPALCTDNAIMIGWVALLRSRAGLDDDSDKQIDIDPNLSL